MSGNGLQLDGPGGAYVRVSGEKQDVERQYADLAAFEEKHGVKVAQAHRYEDHMSRDLSDKRPDFQKMLKAAKTGLIRWVWVQRIDRFGVEDGDELVALRRDLRKAGCRLIDNSGTDWTNRDLLTLIRAGLEGERSRSEQVEKSFRSLDGMVKLAKAGEWMGGPPKLGFDVGCFEKATGEELFRVVWEGRDEQGVKRVKVYPDGRQERFDGNVVFRTSEDTQVLRIVPTRDAARLEAARGLFRRYATESVSFTGLSKWLNDLGIRNAFGKCWQGRDVAPILGDEAYLGYPTFNKNRAGRFHRHAGGKIEELPADLHRTYTASAGADVIRSTRPDGGRWFDPLVDRATWDACQKKLGERAKARPTPRSSGLYLSGLLVCDGCGKPMYARADRGEYFCGTYHQHRCEGRVASSPCLRNAVRHDVLEEYVNAYLEETSVRLELLTHAPETGEHLTDRLGEQEETAWGNFFEGLTRLTTYLAQHHTADYEAILAEQQADHITPDEFVARCVACYRGNFNPDKVTAEIAQAEAELAGLMDKWADLPKIPLVQARAQERMAAAAARIEELRHQQQDAAGVVMKYREEIRDLTLAIFEAKTAMRSEAGAQALRRRAEALRGLLVEVRCEFVVTGKGKGKQPGPGEARSRLAAVSFRPIAGDPCRFAAGADSGNSNATVARTAGITAILFRLLRIRYAA